MLYVDGGVKVSEGFTIVLRTDGDIKVFRHLHQKFTNSV